MGNTAQGVMISDKVAKALSEIVAKARQVDELAAEVAGSSSEQTQSIRQINQAVGQMDKVTQSNAASAEESSAAAEELKSQAEVMRQAVNELMVLVGGARSRRVQRQLGPFKGTSTLAGGAFPIQRFQSAKEPTRPEPLPPNPFAD